MPDTKTKLRPQQSCLKCRERKVKCDRSIPCNACIARGIEAECTYLTTAEDRAHISQAEIIDRLRREVAQLRGRLNQPREPSQSPSLGSRLSPGSDRDRERDERRQYTPGPGSGTGAAHGYGNHSQTQSQAAVTAYGAAYGSRDAQGFLTGHGQGQGLGLGLAHDRGEGSWRGSSPASTMTSSATVMSPESTGSDNGSGLGSASVSGSGSGAGFPLATGFVPQVADFDGSAVAGDAVFGHSLDDPIMSGYYAGRLGASFSPGDMAGLPMMSVPPSGIPTKDGLAGVHAPMYGAGGMEYMMADAGKALPYYPDQSVNYPIPSPQNGEIPQWGDGYSQQGQFQQLYPHQTPSYSSINTFGNMANMNPATANPNTYTDVPPFPDPAPTLAIAVDPPVLANRGSQHIPTPTIMDQIPHSWKGQGKQELLETLLETIGTCDEQSVAQVVQVVRTSASPEEAVSGICRVLGIGSGQ
ncbi:uncharacterized protein N7511_002449 [Penicillium nucicola]|uniref:uncharacterized protein n=1 Tax=Penicillium nucicola TaxID=1850975 RepID=UPI0025452CF2|nr:uncharacterized protein N7511_002449 [Penicillium nucicola]KAJ5770398.1 hypothetical protein N7511_002449 [Penicillium nucicola]